MAFLIDTNIAIHVMEGEEPSLRHAERNEGAIFLSALSLAELHRGVHVSSEFARVRTLRLERLLKVLAVLPFDENAAEAYGKVIEALGWSRAQDYDRLIAGHALSKSYTLVTRNVADFRRVPGLTIETWEGAP